LLERYMHGEPIAGDADIERIATLCRQCGVLEEAQTTIDSYLDDAISAIRRELPPSSARELLFAAAEKNRTRRL
jgi:geranylgeranyl pyrophosphate synthase